ncbi:MAG: bacteriocin [Comamonadaceae bacterium]|nr:MAG: bacteriocin [Comamonadaceae bacterium]
MASSTDTHTAVDADLAAQAVPGHGVPSQDPDPAAQHALTDSESRRESKSALMGGGVMAGAAAGAAVGVAVAGPVGVFVGGTAGAIAGALGGAAVGQAIDPQTPGDAAGAVVQRGVIDKA